MHITNITDNAARVKWTVNDILGHDSIILRLRDNEKKEFQDDIVINRTSTPTRDLTGLKPNNPYTVFLYTKEVQESSPMYMEFRTGFPNSESNFEKQCLVLFCKKLFCKNLCYFQVSTYERANLTKKGTPFQVFNCEFSKIFGANIPKNTCKWLCLRFILFIYCAIKF